MKDYLGTRRSWIGPERTRARGCISHTDGVWTAQKRKRNGTGPGGAGWAIEELYETGRSWMGPERTV